MAISFKGKTYRTLADGLQVNDKQLLEARVNDTIVFPDYSGLPYVMVMEGDIHQEFRLARRYQFEGPDSFWCDDNAFETPEFGFNGHIRVTYRCSCPIVLGDNASNQTYFGFDRAATWYGYYFYNRYEHPVVSVYGESFPHRMNVSAEATITPTNEIPPHIRYQRLVYSKEYWDRSVFNATYPPSYRATAYATMDELNKFMEENSGTFHGEMEETIYADKRYEIKDSGGFAARYGGLFRRVMGSYGVIAEIERADDNITVYAPTEDSLISSYAGHSYGGERFRMEEWAYEKLNKYASNTRLGSVAADTVVYKNFDDGGNIIDG